MTAGYRVALGHFKERFPQSWGSPRIQSPQLVEFIHLIWATTGLGPVVPLQLVRRELTR
jgi:hypothetical protein